MDNKPIATFRERLRTALDIREMKQIDLSQKTKIAKGSINHYLSGYSEPKTDKLYIIAKALNVNEAWLMGYDVSMEREDEWMQEQWERYKSLALSDVYEKFGYNAYVTMFIYENLNDDERNQVLHYAKYTAEQKGIKIPTEDEIRKLSGFE